MWSLERKLNCFPTFSPCHDEHEPDQEISSNEAESTKETRDRGKKKRVSNEILKDGFL